MCCISLFSCCASPQSLYEAGCECWDEIKHYRGDLMDKERVKEHDHSVFARKEKAFKLLKKAADEGHYEACYKVADIIFTHGLIVGNFSEEEKFKAAERYFSKCLGKDGAKLPAPPNMKTPLLLSEKSSLDSRSLADCARQRIEDVKAARLAYDQHKREMLPYLTKWSEENSPAAIERKGRERAFQESPYGQRLDSIDKSLRKLAEKK